MLRSMVAACLLFPSCAAFGQSGPAPLHFEVASIKATSTVPDQWKGAGEAAVSFSPGSATLRNATLRDAIMAAYGLKDYQVSGPGWLTSSRYDIVAKAAEAAPPDQLKQMLQQLLAERSNLKAHRESRELATQTLLKRGGTSHGTVNTPLPFLESLDHHDAVAEGQRGPRSGPEPSEIRHPV